MRAPTFQCLTLVFLLAEYKAVALVEHRFLAPTTRDSSPFSVALPARTMSRTNGRWHRQNRHQECRLRFTTTLQSMTIDPETGISSSYGDESRQIPLEMLGQQPPHDFSGQTHYNGEYSEQQAFPHEMSELFTPHDQQQIDQGMTSTSDSTSSGGSRRKTRNHNEAMGDIAFLRKRTSDILQLTSPEHLASTSFTADAHSDDHQPMLSFNRGGMKVEVNTFNFLIDGWAFSGELDAADQALRLLERMEELYYQHPDLKICPDVRSYTKTINALSRSMRPDAGDLAESILDKMEYVSNNGENVDAKPNTYTYTAVIEAHANSGAEGSPSKTEELLNRMIEKYQSGDREVVPNARCFNAAISAHAKSDVPGAAQQAEYLLNQMDNLYMSGLQEAKPNSFNYNSLISAWANCNEEGSAQRAAEILQRMEQCYAYGDASCKPTTVSFNAVIDAYAKSGLEDAAERAEDVLRRMENLSKAGGDVKPNTRSFNSVMNAWAKSGREDAALKAQDLLEYMQRLYDEGNKSVRPDAHSFVTVINAYARSHMPGKAERANNLFRIMKEEYEDGNNKRVRPSVVAVNAVMNACAYTVGDVPEQNRAMEIAHQKLKNLENSEYGSPDQITYGTFLKVCKNQMPDCSTRQQIMEVIFKKCVQHGQVGNLVLQQLKAMGPPELYLHLVGFDINDDIRMEDLPHEWWCNVVEGKWRRRRNKVN
ncbi:PPR: pentatricopeptide repeat domain containing protein [Nitzschia inconspicua]|uniref:PPR: pentatricopeptide repeat domain containing protein n=1 Tax=Nitzschia inconspicua TaxID=303405 RepID=A0A9K3LC49_9STRA|nr:PPR: pentatricopeptide repeat domain containing protein [Nitzschia inconspicua]